MDQNKNIVIYFFGKLVPALAQLLIIVFGVRILGTESYGKYNLMYNTAMIIASLMVGWIQQGTLRYFHSLKENVEVIRGNFLMLSSLAACLSFFLTLVAGKLYFHLPFLPLLAFSFFTALYSVLLVELTLLQTQFKAILYSVIESGFYIISVGLVIIYMHFFDQKDYTVFFYAMFISLVIILGTRFLIVLFNRNIEFKKISSNFFIQIFRYGFPLTIWILISNTFNVLDRYVIEHFYGYNQVGIYGSVYDLIYKVSGFLTLPLLLAFHPAVAKHWNEHKITEVKQLMRSVIIKEIVMGLFIFSGIFLFRDLIFNDFLKLDVKNFYILFVPLAISSLLWQICIIIQKPLEFNLRQIKMIIGIVLAISSNFIINIILVPLYGIYACGFVTLLSTVIYFIFVYYYAQKEFNSVT